MCPAFRCGHIFSRPTKLKEWLEKQGLTLESRAHLITDAGQYVPGFSMFGPERVHKVNCLDWRRVARGVEITRDVLLDRQADVHLRRRRRHKIILFATA